MRRSCSIVLLAISICATLYANEDQKFLFQRTLIFDTSGLVSRGKEEWVERHLKYVELSGGKGRRLGALEHSMFLSLSNDLVPALRRTLDGDVWTTAPLGITRLTWHDPQFIATPAKVYMLFVEHTDSLSFQYSTDLCATFSAPVILDTAFGTAKAIAVDNNGVIYISWLGEVYGDTKILGVRSSDGGQSFHSFTTIPLSLTHSISFDMIAGNSGKLLITALAAEEKVIKGYYTTDAGVSWDSSAIITVPTGFTLKGTSLARDSSGTLHHTLTALASSGSSGIDTPRFRLLHSASTDEGKTWSKDLIIDSIEYKQEGFWTPYALSFETDLLASPRSLYLAWTEPFENVGPNIIYHRKLYITQSTDQGKTWGPRIQINDSSKGTRGSPHLSLRRSADGIDSIYITWVDGRDVRYLQKMVKHTTSQFEIRPNPATDYISFSFEAEPVAFEIYNSLGAIIKRGELQLSDTQVSCTDLPAGTYIIKLITEMGTQSSQFIVCK